jgi:hypothetical protein
MPRVVAIKRVIVDHFDAFACVELERPSAKHTAQERSLGPEFVQLELSAARVLHEMASNVHAHWSAPSRTIRPRQLRTVSNEHKNEP